MAPTAKRVVVWGTGFVGKFPLRRMTEDGEVADVAMFFASDLAKAVTGQHLLVNAGELMR